MYLYVDLVDPHRGRLDGVVGRGGVGRLRLVSHLHRLQFEPLGQVVHHAEHDDRDQVAPRYMESLVIRRTMHMECLMAYLADHLCDTAKKGWQTVMYLSMVIARVE